MPFLIFAVILLILISVQTVLYKKRALKNVTADVTFSTPIAACGDTITITETIVNRKSLPLPWITLKFEASRELLFLDMTNTKVSDHYYREDLMSLAGWQQQNRHILVLCKRRGYFRFKRLSISTRDLLLLSLIVSDYPCDSTLTVLPQVFNAPEMAVLFRMFLGDEENRRSPVLDPFTFAGIREYQPWDSFKSINWNATAKKNEIMVNVNHPTFHRKIVFIMNVLPFALSRNESLLEKSISLAMTWVSQAVSGSIPVKLLCNSRDILTDAEVDTEYGCRDDHLNRIGIDLARIDLTKRANPFIPCMEKALETSNDLTTYVIISANSDPSLQNFLIEKYRAGIRLTWVVPYDNTNRLPVINPQAKSFAIPLEVGYNA
jgi:uncharacterized protein (DUF58 family)